MHTRPCFPRPNAILPVFLAIPLFVGCAVSEEQEIEMGLEAAPQFEKQFGGLYRDRQVQNYVKDVGMRLVRYTDREDLPWDFAVLDSKEVNAFALPGGPVYITRGLLSKLENEAQLASVLAHEIGHVQHRHSAEQIERTQLAQGGSVLANVVGGALGVGGVGDVASLVSGLTLMRYSRGQEREADLTGLDYIERAGYDPQAIVETMEILKRASGGGGGGGIDFLSTHPSPEDREEYLEKRVAKRPRRDGELRREEFERNVLRKLR